MRPVIAGILRYESLVDGTPLTLLDFWHMNDALNVDAENRRRLSDH